MENIIPPSLDRLSAQLKNKWGWFIAVGLILIVLGLLALTYQFMATIFSVYYLGFLLIIAGLSQIVQAFKLKGSGQPMLWAIMGVLYLIIGLMALYQPIAVSSALTLLLAVLLLMSGTSQLIGALSNRSLPSWGWLLLSSIVTLLLGVIILASWPIDSIWILGMFVGIDLLFQGWAYVMIGFTLKSVK